MSESNDQIKRRKKRKKCKLPHATIMCVKNMSHVTENAPVTLNFDNEEVYDFVEIVGKGIRNSVGMDWDPSDSSKLWFTDNGIDDVHPNYPDDTLGCINLENERIEDFGFPYCHTVGSGDPYLRDTQCISWYEDVDIGHLNPLDGCNNYTHFQIPLGPHTVSLGMRFYTGYESTMFPTDFDNTIIVAQRGSASVSREEDIGYRVVILKLDDTDTTKTLFLAAPIVHRG